MSRAASAAAFLVLLVGVLVFYDPGPRRDAGKGIGKEFSAAGTVVAIDRGSPGRVDGGSVTVKITAVDYANGRSGDDIVVGRTEELFDNYTYCDWNGLEKRTVGVATDGTGEVLDADTLRPGTQVTFTGMERDHQTRCASSARHDRRVYRTLTVEPG